MAKYYISCGTLQLIYSTDKDERNACKTILWECNENDTLDEYFYVDERGYRGYNNADPKTMVFPTDEIIKETGFSL